MRQNISPIYIVTGATGGIGKEIARALAAQRHAVMLACRNAAKAESLRAELAAAGNGETLVGELSLDSAKSVKDFAAMVEATGRPIAALIHNAGTMERRRQVTADGFERTLAVNFLAPAALTLRLLPQVADGGVITFTTSVTRRLHSLKEPILDEPESRFSQLGTYGRTKLALTHFAAHVAQLPSVRERHIRVACADPGIVNTSMISMSRWYDPIADILFRPLISKPATGAKATLRAIGSDLTAHLFTPNGKPKPIDKTLRRGDIPLRPALIAATLKVLS